MPILPLLRSHLNQQLPTSLYHYTNQSGFLGIMQSWELWATQIQFLNDTSELSLAKPMALSALNALAKSKKFDNHKWLIELIIQGKDSDGPNNIFVSSFSEEHNSLSQWRAYGGCNSGYAVGFNSSDLKKIAEKNDFTLAKCIYDEDVQIKFINDFVNQFVKIGVTVYPFDLFDHDNDPDIKKMVRRFYTQLLFVAPLLKNAHFREEREWRLIANKGWELAKEYDPDPDTVRNIGFRQGASMILPFYRLPLNIGRSNKQLYEIIVGPTPNISNSIESVAMCVRLNNIMVNDVRGSEIPFRSW